MAKAFGIKELIDTNFKSVELSDKWKQHLGEIERNCCIMVIGAAKNGKTDYCMKLTKELALRNIRTFYNSHEQGKSKTLRNAVIRNNMGEVAGKVLFGNKEPFAVMIKRMTGPGSYNAVLIDSWDYMNLTAEQFKEMRLILKRKMIIIVCWADGKRPDNSEAKKIEHMADIIVPVKDFKAKAISRYDGNGLMDFRDKQIGQGDLFFKSN